MSIVVVWKFAVPFCSLYMDGDGGNGAALNGPWINDIVVQLTM